MYTSVQMKTIFIGQSPREKRIASAHLKQMECCGLNCAPEKRYAEVLTSCTYECDPIWK